MAQPIQVPLVGAALQEMFGLQGRVRPALEEFIMPVVLVGAIDAGAPPATSRTAIAAMVLGATAGERATWRFEVPPGSLAELLWMDASAPAAEVIKANFPGNAATIGPLANAAASEFIDGRVLAGAAGGGQVPSAVLTYGTQAAVLAKSVARFYLQADVPRRIDFPPGTIVGTARGDQYGFVEFQYAAANTALTAVTLAWREYSLV